MHKSLLCIMSQKTNLIVSWPLKPTTEGLTHTYKRRFASYIKQWITVLCLFNWDQVTIRHVARGSKMACEYRVWWIFIRLYMVHGTIDITIISRCSTSWLSSNKTAAGKYCFTGTLVRAYLHTWPSSPNSLAGCILTVFPKKQINVQRHFILQKRWCW